MHNRRFMTGLQVHCATAHAMQKEATLSTQGKSVLKTRRNTVVNWKSYSSHFQKTYKRLTFISSASKMQGTA